MLDMSDLQAALSCFHAFKDSEDSPACMCCIEFIATRFVIQMYTLYI